MFSRTLGACLVLLMTSCNLFGSTPDTPDTGGSADQGGLDMPAADMATVDDGAVDMAEPADMIDSPDDADMGGPCMNNSACPLELACLDGACSERLQTGDVCEESDDCVGGLCSAGVCVDLGTPLARYRVNESGSGATTTLLRDDAADPLDLALNFEGVSEFGTDPEGNRYVRLEGLQSGGSAPIAGTKIEDAFDGGTTGTLEVKSMTFLCEDNQHRVLGIGSGGSPTDNGWFTLREFGGSDYIYVKFLPNVTTTQLRPTPAAGCMTMSPVVTHVVVDTTAPSEADRVRLYVDGRRTTLQRDAMAEPYPTLNQGLDIGLPATDRYIVLGRPNPVSGNRTTNQRVWYGATYDVALPDALIQRNAARILHRDDEETDTGIVTRTVGALGDFESLQAWYDARRGDLTRRFVIRTTDTSGAFTAGERVSSPGGCSGTVLAEDRDGTHADFLTLDAFESGCAANAVLTGATSGASARFGGVLLRGTIERAAILDPAVEGAMLSGSTTSAQHHFVITSASDQGHRGQLGTGAAIQPSEGLLVGVPHTRIDGVRIANAPAGGAAVRIEAPDVTVRNALIEVSGLNAVEIAADRVVVEDSIIFASGQHGIAHEDGADVMFRNLTIIGSGTSGIASIGGPTVHNVIADGTPAFSAEQAWGEASNNISTDATAPGSGSQTNVASASLFVSLTPGSEDLHLVAGSPAVDMGADTGAVSWDVDLQARRGAWDIGADER